MAISISETLTGVASLNRPDQPFSFMVEGTSIIGRWRWQDQTLFAPDSLTNEIREFTFIVDLNDDGTYKERTQEASTTLTAGSGGVGFQKSSFAGNSSRKRFSVSIGKDNQTGEVGVVSTKWDSDMIKRPLREYLANLGWKPKGGFISRLFS